MSFDFDKIPNRRGSNSLKWHVGENELPMWVADMDFETAPAIKKAIAERASDGIYGYEITPDAWYDAYTGWWERRHAFRIEKDWLIFCTGVIPAISSTIRKLTTPGENVLIQTPVYNIFFNSIINNGRNVVENPLAYDGTAYTIVWEDLEEKLADPQTTLFLLCNPHNPVGKLWDRKTLERIGELCKKYGVTVLSDEIHCDLTEPRVSYVPFASASEICKEISITCVAPTKTFNLAGIQTAAVFAANPALHHKVWRALNTDEVAEGNAFAHVAAIAAFNEGGEWLDALREYVSENKRFVAEYLEREIPALHAVKSEATYLTWIDCRALPKEGVGFSKFLREKTGLYLSRGIQYGKNGEGFVRMNLACPRRIAEEGMRRLADGVRQFKKAV